MKKQSQSEIPLAIASAYESIPKEEEEAVVEPSHVVQMTTFAEVDLTKPAGRGVSPEYASIPEAQGLTWNDDFFDDEDGIIAVFDFDYDSMESHYRTMSWGCLGASVFCIPHLIPFCLLGFVPCYINKNVTWNVRAQHLAVTRDGIFFVHDRRPACWGEQCAVSKRTKTIPFDQITDCTVADRSDATCVMGSRPLTTVTVDTPSSHGGNHELSITGLDSPMAFQKLILAMKRNYQQGGAASSLPVTMTMAERQVASGNSNNENLEVLLREIRDELRQNNEALRSGQVTAVVTPSAPSEADV